MTRFMSRLCKLFTGLMSSLGVMFIVRHIIQALVNQVCYDVARVDVDSPLSQRQTSNGMTKPILYHKTHTAWQKSYCMSFAMPSYFPWIHGKTHVISARPYPWLFPCSNLSLVSQLFAFDSTF